jgi:hypothetical protein
MALLGRCRWIAAIPRCRSRAAAIASMLAVLATVASPTAGATAGEVCRFEGTTSHVGRIAVRSAEATAADGQTVVAVALSLHASA